MPSLITGFEYDIFVSYRQKDNKYDGWVSDFVANLKRELEATFKEEISLYFDENPHDGLLETHNVDRSLEGKLKCLIFIPIVSQTYCDPKSFAWQHEFLAFNKMSRADEFGMNVKLGSNNVCGRVLPIRIHELDPEDKALMENELDCVLRPIDFIYRSAGVNRPLRSNEDNPSSNLNKTFYRNQINKVANAVKEIVHGMVVHKLPSSSIPQPRREIFSGKKNPFKSGIKIAVWVILAIVFGLTSYYSFSSYQHKREVRAIQKGAIAILSFENQTGRTDLNSIGQVAADFISTQLIHNKFWKVIPTQDIFRQTVYSGVVTNPEAEKKIVNQGTVDYLVLGHYSLINDSVLLVVSVNDVRENKILYTTPVIKCAVTNPMKAVLDAQQFILGFLIFSTDRESTTTRPPKYGAYQEYLKGMELWTKNEIGPGNIAVRTSSEIEKHFKNAISMDSDFLPPYFKLSELFSIDRKFLRLDSVLQILETKQNLFLAGDHLNFTMQKLLISKDWNALENFLLTKTEVGSSDFRPYYQLAVNALFRQNKPRKALEYIARCDLTEFDFTNKPSDQLIYLVQTEALIKLKQYDEVVALTDNFSFKKVIPGILLKRWISLYLTNRKEQVFKELDKHTATLIPIKNYYPHMALFRYGQLHGDSVFMLNLYDRFTQLTKVWDEKMHEKTWSKFVVAVMMFRTKKNIPEAENLLNQNLPIVPRPRRMHQLGILYAVTGREAKANEVIEDLLSHENEFDNGLTRYYVAKIEAELGHKEKSVEFLSQSIDKGMEFREDLFEYDADLKKLMDFPPFIELVRPKE